MTTLEIALQYLESGLSVIPIKPDSSKQPAISWKQFQERLPTAAEAHKWWDGTQNGIAIICGKVSGGLEVLDFDSSEAFTSWVDLVVPSILPTLNLLPQVKTPDSGMHVYYRSASIAGNTKLAMDPKGQVEIETRGEGGYVLAPGSPANCHPSKKTYRRVAGPSLLNIPRIEDL